MTTVAVLSAGLSQPSSTRLLAGRLAEAVARKSFSSLGADVDIVHVELRELAHEITDNLLTGFPGKRLREAIGVVTDADALIAVTPVFSASYSGLFKSFFDVLDRDALRDKPTLIAATGGSARHSLVLEFALRPLMSYLHARVVSTAVFVATEDFGSDDAGASVNGRIDAAATELVMLLGAGSGASKVDPFDLSTSFEELLLR
jgi:FMN reductase